MKTGIGFLLVLVAGVLLAENILPGFKPKDGFVPDEKTAIAIAVAVWSPVYGEKEIQAEKPYRAILKNGIWHIEGTLPEATPGGVAVAEISKEDGRVIGVGHGQ